MKMKCPACKKTVERAKTTSTFTKTGLIKSFCVTTGKNVYLRPPRKGK